jgi:hypothetical protein
LSIIRPLAQIFIDTRPNSALKRRRHGASLCRRSYRSTAPSGIGQDKRKSRDYRGPRSVDRGPQQSSPRFMTMKTSLPWTVERGPWTVLTTSNVSRVPTQEPPGQSSVQTLELHWKSAISRHLSGRPACLPGGNPGSASRCSNMR